MTITAAGFAGVGNQVSDVQWARIHQRPSGAPEHAEGSGWVVAPTGATREVSIASGYLYGCGVEAFNDTSVALTVAANSSGSTRYDMVVAVFDWPSRTVTLTIRQNISSVAALTRSIGSTWDVPLAMLTVNNAQGVFSAGQVLDLRPVGRGRLTVTAAAGFTGITALYANARNGSVQLTGTIRRSGSDVNVGGDGLVIGSIPARLNPDRLVNHEAVCVGLVGLGSSASTNDRAAVPVYLTYSGFTQNLTVFNTNSTLRFLQNSSFVHLGGTMFVVPAQP